MAKEIPAIMTRTDGESPENVVLPHQTPIVEMSEVSQTVESVQNYVREDPNNSNLTTYENGTQYYADQMALRTLDWSFARVLRQFLIVASGALASIALSVGRYVDEKLKKKIDGYRIKITEFPAGSTNVVFGEVNRYMPLGWYAWYCETVDGQDTVKCYSPIQFIYVLDTVAVRPSDGYTGLHIEPSQGVKFEKIAF